MLFSNLSKQILACSDAHSRRPPIPPAPPFTTVFPLSLKAIMAPTPSLDATSPSFIERVHDFVGEHKKTIVIAAAAVAVAGGLGVAYYASTSKPPSGGTEETGKTKKDKKKKSSGKGSKKGAKKVGDAEGPILEERKPTPAKSEDGKGMFN